MQYKVSGEGTPIVLVPGGLTGWVSWEPFAEIFSAKQRKVVAVQLISVQYGLENRPLPENYTVETESRALADVLDSLRLTAPVDVVAWSFGAFTSLNYALNHAERIRTLTLIEPPAMWVLRETGKWDDELQQAADFFQKFHGDITEDMLEVFLQYAGFLKPGQNARELPQWNNWTGFRQSLRNSPSVISHNDSVQRLKNFQPPVLLVKGAGSAPWLHRVIDSLSENIPHSRIIEFPGGHAPHLVSRDSFLAELEKFQKAGHQQ
ncbi:MAG: alpha/beta hydrolase [Chlorobi bacterium]|nr:alpha/beta hydrolase [Chlorobiota bacterium]MCI0716235.1 alpha/beta hydrolase [Chlorobiota bacterium]